MYQGRSRREARLVIQIVLGKAGIFRGELGRMARDFQQIVQHLLFFFRSSAVSATDPVVDEFGARGFQRMLNRADRALRRSRLRPAFYPPQSGERYMGSPCEFALIESEQGSGGADLLRCDHENIYINLIDSVQDPTPLGSSRQHRARGPSGRLLSLPAFSLPERVPLVYLCVRRVSLRKARRGEPRRTIWTIGLSRCSM